MTIVFVYRFLCLLIVLEVYSFLFQLKFVFLQNGVLYPLSAFLRFAPVIFVNDLNQLELSAFDARWSF